MPWLLIWNITFLIYFFFMALVRASQHDLASTIFYALFSSLYVFLTRWQWRRWRNQRGSR